MAERSKRQIKPTKRFIEEIENNPVKLRNLDIDELKEIVKNNKRKPSKKQPEKPLEVLKSPTKSTVNTPKAPIKSNKTEARTLNLDLSDVPPSEDFKFSQDFSEYSHEFWQKFYTPNDNTTQEYIEATDKLGDILPANFRLIKGIKEAFGVANLELKEEYIKPIKKIPLFSKLENGDYETAQSKSDKKNIAGSIKFFRNNLASFIQYKNDDDIRWVITHHRQLIAEILEYYANKEKPSLSTIKGRFNAITRIFRIAYETKNYDLYDKYSGLVIFLGRQFEADEFDNELSEEELKKFIPFNVVLEKQKELQNQFEMLENKKSNIGYNLNQDLLLVSLYSLIPPLRLEPMTLKFSKNTQHKDNWIIIKPNEVLMDLNEIKKKHPAIVFNLTNDVPELASILRESYELYPREYIFTYYNKYPDVSRQISVVSLTNRLNNIFSYTGKSVGVNALRSSYVSYMNSEAIKNGKQLTVNQKEKIAYKMRSSRKAFDEAYLKIFSNEQQIIQQASVIKPIDKQPPINEQSPVEKQNQRTKKYYNENKEKVLAQQKEYKNKKSTFEQSRIKMLYYLNSDAEYYKKMMPKTQQKYNFKKENGRWI